MPSDISNAVGTARQFTPQPDRTYQGNYLGVSPTQSSVGSFSRTAQLAQNLENLNSALLGHMVSHEKWRDAVGHEMAERMINGMSQDDIKRLDTIDAAQQEGYVDETANPYFVAYAEKLRGGFLASQMKKEYDLKYDMSPAKSMDEEARRYNEFSSEWKKNNLVGLNEPSNYVAFDKGFNENQLVNVNNLTTNWSNTKRKEDIQLTFASMNNKLGSLISNAQDILKTPNLMTQQFQSVMNEGRLMGLPVEYRGKLLEDFATQWVQKGLDYTRLKQMLKGTTIQTSIDGTKTTADSLLNFNTYDKYATTYAQNHFTQDIYEWTQKYRKMGKSGIAAMWKDLDNLKATNPMQYEVRSRYAQSVISQIEADDKQHQAQLARQLGSRAAGKSSSSSSGKISVTDPSDINALISAHLNGDTMVAGHPLADYKYDAETWLPALDNEIKYLMTNNDTQDVIRLMAMPQLKEHKNEMGEQLNLLFASVERSSDGGVNIGGDPTMMNFMKFFSTDANMIREVFGDKLANNAMILQRLVRMHGSLDAALPYFADYMHMDDETKSKAMESARNLVEGTIGVDVLNPGAPSTWDTSTNSYMEHPAEWQNIQFGEMHNSLLRTSVEQCVVAYIASGMSPEAAWDTAKADLQENYFAYHQGLIPKAILNNIGTSDDEGYATWALDQLCYQCNEDDAGNVILQYDPNQQDIVATYYGSQGTWGNTVRLPIEGENGFRAMVKNHADHAQEWADEHPQTNTPVMSYADMQASRQALEEASGTSYEAEAYSNYRDTQGVAGAIEGAEKPSSSIGETLHNIMVGIGHGISGR